MEKCRAEHARSEIVAVPVVARANLERGDRRTHDYGSQIVQLRDARVNQVSQILSEANDESVACERAVCDEDLEPLQSLISSLPILILVFEPRDMLEDFLGRI